MGRIKLPPSAERPGWRLGALTIAATMLMAPVISACGDDTTESGGPSAAQRITRDFGREPLSAERVPLEGEGTVLGLLRDQHDVETTSPSDRVIASIDGLRARERGESETIWVLNVNGIEADVPPPEYRLHAGDVVQWDLRDWYTLLSTRATVGAFPQTFARGMFGRRFPTTVECELPDSVPCKRVKGLLEDAGVEVDGSRPPGARPPANAIQRARVLVGRWKHWRERPWAERIDRGARYSGVFARFTDDAAGIRLLDWDARTVRTVGIGSGLVAAQRPTEEDLLWVVTGVDDNGVERAARALGSSDLRDAFAAVVTPAGLEKVPLPLENPDGPRNRETD